VVDRLLYRGAPARLHGRFRDAAGYRVYERVCDRADGPTVVLVHGIGVSGRYLLPTAGRLAMDHRVYVPDLPGFGHSGRLRQRPTVRLWADLLGAWLDAAGLERPDAIVANSFGCQLTVDLLSRHPARARSLVLLGPTIDRRARSLVTQAGRLALDLTREPLGLFAVELVDYALHTVKSGPLGFAAMVRDRVEEKLPCVPVRTLVVRGRRDAIAPRRWVAEVAARLPDGRTAEVDGAHAAHYSRPDAVAALIAAFVRAGSPLQSATR
jgi:pimeloyl-ACP methyl ester carboxylesterase